MAGTVWLLIMKPLSPLFMVVYTLTGVTDALDGAIARKYGTTSELGAKLDSIADLLFYTVILIRIFPVMWVTLPKVIWVAVAAILFVRGCAYATFARKYHRFASLHTSKSLSEVERLRLMVAKLEVENARLKKGYWVEGAGANKEYVTGSDRTTKSSKNSE